MGRLYRRGEEVPIWAEGISWAAYERWLWELPKERIEDRVARRDWERKRAAEEAEAERKTKMRRNRN